MIIAFVLALFAAAFLVIVTAAARSDWTFGFIPAGTSVKKGYYFAARTWSLTPVAQDGQVLPGGAAERYLRVPLLATVLLAPLMGALFVICLPFLSVYVAARALVAALTRATRHGAKEVAATLVPGLRVGDAHLTGQGEEKNGTEPSVDVEPPADARLDALENEIAARRHREKQ